MKTKEMPKDSVTESSVTEKAMPKETMADMQSQVDTRNIAIDKVGVKDIRHPIEVLDKQKKNQHTVANINMYVSLPHHFKGTHMSRFLEILNEHSSVISVKNFPEILDRMKERFEATTAHLELEFSYFIERAAPVSGVKGLMDYKCSFKGAHGEDGKTDFVLGVQVPVTTLCPCSKEISDYGAHNQRGLVTVSVRSSEFVWIEDVIEAIEETASCPVYPILKRPDEKFVTEKAYDNPKFVEDMVRDVAVKLGEIKGVTWSTIEAENFESIHNHSAYAFLEKDYTAD